MSSAQKEAAHSMVECSSPFPPLSTHEQVGRVMSLGNFFGLNLSPVLHHKEGEGQLGGARAK